MTPAEYYDAADLWPLDPNGNMLLMGIIEEPEGVKNLPDILREVKGIGAIWAGPGDMSVSMGHKGNASHPDVQANLLKILADCKNAGVPCATGATAAEVPMRLEQGFPSGFQTAQLLLRNLKNLQKKQRTTLAMIGLEHLI